MHRKILGLLLAAGIAGSIGFGGAANAQELSPGDNKIRPEGPGIETQDIMQQLQRLQSGGAVLGSPQGGAPTASGATQPSTLTKEDVKKIVEELQKAKDDKKKADDDAAKCKAEEEGYKIGTSLNMTASWNNGLFLTTPNGDFTSHIGGWIQYDNVFYNQSSILLNKQSTTTRPGQPGSTVASGPLIGGVGDEEDGTYFRRIRLMTDGVFFENYEYTLILALENNEFSMIGLDEFWVGAKDIPLIGTARIGHVKTPMGFEGDMTASSRTMTFMERSSYSEAIENNQNFVTGLWLGDNYCDQRATYSAAIFRSDFGSSTGVFFGDGQYGMQGRLTALPIWEEDGRCWMHVGVSGGWRNGSNSSNTATYQLRARPELRDDDPAGNPSGAQAVPNANDARMIDTGGILAQDQWLLGTEFCWVMGAFSVQAEYGFNWVDNATAVLAPATSTLTPLKGGSQNYMFSGGYVQLAYTLTGENRSYDKRLGRLDTYYFSKSGPYNNAWFVRGDDGCYNFNCGAWEIAARYSYTDLNSGHGVDTIQGGVMNGTTVGLNWYLNTNLKFQFDYVYDQRSALPPATTAANAVYSGYVQGLGIRMQFMY